jgi:hypothetical protein
LSKNLPADLQSTEFPHSTNSLMKAIRLSAF